MKYYKQNTLEFVNLFFHIRRRSRTVRRGRVSICDDLVHMDPSVIIFCRNNFGDSMMLDHVSDLTMSQLCSFITLYTLLFLFLLLCWVLKHFRLSIFGPFLPVGLCWGLHWRSRCAFFGAHSGPALLWPVLGRVQWQCDTFPTMLGWRRGSICLFHVLFCCFGWFFFLHSYETEQRLNRRGPCCWRRNTSQANGGTVMACCHLFCVLGNRKL